MTEQVASVFRARLVAAVILGEGVDGHHLALSDPSLGPRRNASSSGRCASGADGFEVLRRRFPARGRRPGAGGLPEAGRDVCSLRSGPAAGRAPHASAEARWRAGDRPRAEGSPLRRTDVQAGREHRERPRAVDRRLGPLQELDQFFAASLELLCMIDFGGRLHRLNLRWRPESSAMNPQELEGAMFLDLVHPEDRPATTAAFGDLIDAGVPARFVNRFRAATGPTAPWSGSPARGRT